ncbi:MAG: DegT/DnrJ/EryC1/StrS aminotransferase family protein [Anaerolineae bacterium]|nr:DegT/DnrJ/EryC1/StrS aminotransferase family protein [Anaerolineae bacterium]
MDSPVREKRLPFCLPDVGEAEIEEVIDTLRSGWLTTGPKTKKFEQAFAAYVGAPEAVAVNSCTGGLHVTLAALGIGPGDEVIVPTMTFAATANVVVHVGATPVMVDVAPDTLNVDPAAVEAAITPRTRAVVPVHLYGHPCAMDRIMAIAERHNLFVVEDAAHSVAAEWNGRRVGSLGNPTVFSFYAIKNMTTGEGGMITVDDSELAERMRVWLLHGMSRDAWKRYEATGSWYYEIVLAGLKYNMTDVQAAMGLHQLARLEEMTRRRAELAARYTEAFRLLPELILPAYRDGVRHVWHLYPIRLRLEQLTIDRNAFIEALSREGIGTSVHFIPLHRHPYYRDRFGLHPADFPTADAAYQQLVSLPLYPRMSDQDAADVVEAVRRVVGRHRK